MCGCWSDVRKRKEWEAGWMGEWEEGERMGGGWMDAGVGEGERRGLGWMDAGVG